MPLNAKQRSIIKEEIKRLILGDPELAQEIMFDYSLLVKLKNTLLEIIDFILKNVSHTTAAGDIENILSELHKFYDADSISREMCTCIDVICIELTAWARVSQEKINFFKGNNSNFKRAEVGKYIKELFSEYRNELIKGDIENKPLIAELSATDTLVSFHLQLAKAMRLQDETVSFKDGVNLDKCRLLDPNLAEKIDKFQMLSSKLNDKKDYEALKEEYEKIIAICILSAKIAINKEYAIYYAAIHLEYTIRYYHIVFQANEKKIQVGSLHEQYIKVIFALRHIDEITKRYKFPHKLVFKPSYQTLLPPNVSKYLLPFLPEIREKEIIVELPMEKRVTLEDEKSIETFTKTLDELKQEFHACHEINHNFFVFLLDHLDANEKKLELIKSLAYENDSFFECLVKTKLWEKLDLQAKLRDYRQNKLVKEGFVAHIVHLKDLALSRNKKTISLDKSYLAVFSVLDEINKLLPHDKDGKWLLDESQKYYIPYLATQISYAGEHYCKKAQLALNLGVQGFMESNRQLQRCFHYVNLIPENLLANESIKKLFEHAKELELKIEDLKRQRNINLEKLQKEESEKQEEIIFYPKRINHQKPERKHDEKNDAKIQSESKETIQEQPIDPEQQDLDTIGKLLCEGKYKSAIESLPRAKSVIKTPLYEFQFHMLEAEAYRLEASLLAKRVKLFTHIKGWRATPVTEQELQDIRDITRYFKLALKACKASRQDKYVNHLSEDMKQCRDLVYNTIRDRLNIFKISMLKFHLACEYRKALIKAKGKWGNSNTGFSKPVHKLEDSTNKLTALEKQEIRENQKLSIPDFYSLVDPSVYSVLDLLKSKGLTVILYGGYIRDKLRNMVKPSDVDVVLIVKPGFDHEKFLKSLFLIDEKNIKKNPYRPNHYSVFFSGTKYDFEFEDSMSAEEVQKKLAKQSDCYANSLSVCMNENGFEPIFDLSGNGISDAVNGVIDIQNFDDELRDDPFRLLRYLNLIANKKFTVPEYLINLDIEIMENYVYLLMKQCQEMNEWGRLRHNINKLFLQGHAESVFQLLVNYRIFEAVYPEIYERLKFTEFEEEIRSKLSDLDKRYANHESLYSNDLSIIIGELNTAEAFKLSQPSIATQTIFSRQTTPKNLTNCSSIPEHQIALRSSS